MRAAQRSERAELAYLQLLPADARGDGRTFFARHPHVAAIAVRPALPAHAYFVQLLDASLRAAEARGASYAYVVAVPDGTKAQPEPVGGAAIEMLRTKGQLVGAGRVSDVFGHAFADGSESAYRVHASVLVRDRLYDRARYADERRRGDDGDGNTDATHQRPFYLFGGDEKWSTADEAALIAVVPREQLLRRRWRALQCAADNEGTRAQLSDANYRRALHTISERTAFDAGGGGADEADVPAALRAAADSLSARLLYRYVVCVSTAPDSAARRWIARHEEVLARFRLAPAPPPQQQHHDDALHVLRAHGLLHPSRHPLALREEPATSLDRDLQRECEALFAQRRAHAPTAAGTSDAVWFSAPAASCARLALACLSGSTAPMRAGRCYLSLADVCDDYVPRVVAAHIRDAIDERGATAADDDDPALMRVGAQLVNELQQRHSSSGCGDPVPPIEECANATLLPPCALALVEQLRGRHLHFAERTQLSGFMLDMGYDKATVAAYFREYDVTQHGVAGTVFDSKYMHIVRHRNRKPVPGDTTGRLLPYGSGCARLAQMPVDDTSAAAAAAAGCPFHYMQATRLQQLLRRYATDARGRAVADSIARERPAPGCEREACARVFALRAPPPATTWVPSSPQGYFRTALRTRTRPPKRKAPSGEQEQPGARAGTNIRVDFS